MHIQQDKGYGWELGLRQWFPSWGTYTTRGTNQGIWRYVKKIECWQGTADTFNSVRQDTNQVVKLIECYDEEWSWFSLLFNLAKSFIPLFLLFWRMVEGALSNTPLQCTWLVAHLNRLSFHIGTDADIIRCPSQSCAQCSMSEFFWFFCDVFTWSLCIFWVLNVNTYVLSVHLIYLQLQHINLK